MPIDTSVAVGAQLPDRTFHRTEDEQRNGSPVLAVSVLTQA